MNTFGLVSHAAAFVAFTALAIMLVPAVRRRYTPAAGRLLVAVTVSAVWALALAIDHSRMQAPGLLLLLLEIARDGAWLNALLGVAPAALPRFLPRVAWGAWGLWLASALLFGLPVTQVISGGGFVMALIMLLLLEQVYRNTSEVVRHELKFLAIGVGGLFTYDLFLYAQAELLNAIDGLSWYARGLTNAVMVPLLALGARRLPDNDLRVFVSRQVTFYTTTFLAAGVYLLLMSAAGWLIREFGGDWGETARGLFLVGAFAILVLLVASAAMRRRLRVFVSKHFYRNKYDYRIEWLRFIRTLSSSEETDVHRGCVHAVAQTLNSPGGVLFTLDESGRQFEPVAGWPVPVAKLEGIGPVAADASMIELMRRRRWIIDTHERRERPSLYEDVTVPGWLESEPRWRIVSPIFRLDSMVGFFLLFDPPPPFELSFEDRDLLHTMGQHVATLLAQHESDRRVAELSQFETYNRLTAFLMHDLKNCAAQLSLVVGNATKHRHNPQFVDDAIETVANTSERMTRLIEQLSRRVDEGRPRPPVKLADVVTQAVERCRARRPQPEFVAGRDCHSLVAAERDQLVAAIEHVVRNAQDATSESGHVSVAISDASERVRVTISDDGAGMDAEFLRQDLFRPFHSTKGSKGMGIGAYQARELARSLGGDVEVESHPGAGTRFSFILPVAS
jgi:putative PEP-CTERM system histidine kinase